ncbi:hypothetical protein [uncultured Oceanisphaera sp.]|uniref:hypothetical protein n=1 Tax=uncultured Oceanisphaera sp. TaxID=353858 RepID=UPI002623C44A|nr:hypothetical protein [uncultured Oceanisphaera sp.]
MKRLLTAITGIMAMALLVACGKPTTEIAHSVKASLQRALDSEFNLQPQELSVDKVEVSRNWLGGHSGTAHILYREQWHEIPLKITLIHGEPVWELSPEAIQFITRNPRQSQP